MFSSFCVISSGPNLCGHPVCYFVSAGDLTFDGLSINDGNEYVLLADCGSPYGEIESREFKVSDLEVRFNTQPPVATRKEGTFSVTLAFWDPVSDALAIAPLPSDITCELKYTDGSDETTISSDTISGTCKLLKIIHSSSHS